MDSCCFCSVNDFFKQLNRDDEFLMSTTLAYLDIKYAKINLKVCLKCLKYLRIISQFVNNSVSIGLTFTACLTNKRLVPLSGSVKTFSPLMDWFNVNSLISNQVNNKLVIDSRLHNIGLHTPLAKQPAVFINHDTKFKKKQCKLEIFKRNSYNYKIGDHLNFSEKKNVPVETHISENSIWNYTGGERITCAFEDKTLDVQAVDLLSHSIEKQFQCTVCKKSFNQRIDLETHVPTHSSKKRYQCTICKKSLSFRRTLKLHLMTHTNEKPYLCTICKKPFRESSHLKSHYLFIHSEKKPPHHCKVCKKSFSHNCNLKTHLRTHSNEKPFKCTICEKPFNKHIHLNAHILSHTNEKPFQCTICKKSFKRRDYLKIHLQIHDSVKRYQCTVCEKTFGWKCSLNVHLLTHTDEKPYQCTICNKSFRQSSHLKTHLNFHTKEKPH